MTNRLKPTTLALIVLAALVALAAYTVAFRAVFTSRFPGANDFFSRWAGAHLYLTRGWDPYGDDASLWIQQIIYGHPARPEEDPSLFAYPFYTVFLVAPYALIADYSWAQAAWQVTLQVVALAALGLTLAYHRWRPGPLVLAALVLWTVLFYPTARSLILGQIGLVVFLLTVWAFFLLFRAQNTHPPSRERVREAEEGVELSLVLAGILLAISTVKPQMQFLVIPFLLLYALRHRRWGLILGFAAAMTLLLVVSFALLPTWFAEWIGQVRLYPSYTPPAVLFILTREVVPLGPAAPFVERALDAILLAYLLYEWWRVLWHDEHHRLDWTLGLTLVVTHLVAPRTATTHFAVFLFPLLMILRDGFRRGGAWTFAGIALMLVLLVGMWWLFAATLVGDQEANLVHVPLPLLVLVLLLLARPGNPPAAKLELSPSA